MDKCNCLKKLIENANSLKDIQGENGNWNCDPYMHGLYNGMEMIISILENREPEFREAPNKWLDKCANFSRSFYKIARFFESKFRRIFSYRYELKD